MRKGSSKSVVKSWISSLDAAKSRLEGDLNVQELRRFCALSNGFARVNTAVSNDLRRLRQQGVKPSKKTVAFNYL